METEGKNCRFFNRCGPSGINNFYLKGLDEHGGPAYRNKYCYGDPSNCPFFKIRSEIDQKKKEA